MVVMGAEHVQQRRGLKGLIESMGGKDVLKEVEKRQLEGCRCGGEEEGE